MPRNYQPKGRYRPGLAALNIKPAMTYEEIGAELGVTKQVIERIEKRALHKIRLQLGLVAN